MERGKFIVFEGTDGTGKSTNARRAAEYLEGQGVPCLLTCEPTDGEIGKLLRRFLKGEIEANEKAVAALFLADRLDHITKKGGLLDALNAGTTVICDRYYLSSVAYNCPGESAEYVAELNRAALDLLSPDLTVYLDMPLEKLAERISKRDTTEIYETLEYQRKVKQRYEQGLALSRGKVLRVNSNRDRLIVQAEIRAKIKEFLEL